MKIIPTIWRGLLGCALLSQPAFAVYPPSTSMMDEPQPVSGGIDPAETRRLSLVTDKLQDKERLLDGVLKDLKKDEQDFKKTVQSIGARAPAAPADSPSAAGRPTASAPR